jgi:hypothetical protein
VAAGESRGSLTIVAGPGSGRGFILPLGTTVLGRGQDADVILADSSVSRRHAELHAGAAKVVIRDLGSSNGTFVNGARLTGSTELHDGDEVRVGSVVLRSDGVAGVSLSPRSGAGAEPQSGSTGFRDVHGAVQTGAGHQSNVGRDHNAAGRDQYVSGRDQHVAGRDQHFDHRVNLQNDYDPWDEIWQGRGVGRALMIVGGLVAVAGFAMWATFIFSFFGMDLDPRDVGNPFMDVKLIGDIPLSIAGFASFAIGGVLAGIGGGMSKAARKRAEQAIRDQR